MRLSRRYATAIMLACLVATGGGCSALRFQHAQVLPQLASSRPGQISTLRSAFLFYRRAKVANGGTVAIASFGSNRTASREIELLAIRYPNPNGSHDTALAELVVFDAESAPNGATTVQDRLSGWLRESLPGIGWSKGVKEAKAYTLPVDQLQQLIASCQSTGGVQSASAQDPAAETELLIDINGKVELQPSGGSRELDALLYTVRTQGRLVSYLVGSGAKFSDTDNLAELSRLEGPLAARENLLVRLPPAVSSGGRSSLGR